MSSVKEGKKDSSTPTPKKEFDQMTIVKKLRKMLELLHMYDALYLLPTAKFLVEQASSKFVVRNGDDGFFKNSSEVERLHHKCGVLGMPFACFNLSK